MAMKIAVLAANGRSGQVFVHEALKAGHQVWAGVYGSHSLPAHDNLEIIKCDGMNPDDVSNLVKGCDAVVSLIGHTKNSAKNVQTKSITNLVDVISGSDIRLVSLTGTGVRFDGDSPSLVDRFLNFGIKLIDPNRINDGINHAQVIKDSDTNWTIIRVLKLSNSTAKSYSLTTGGPAKLLTSRTEVAQAILEVLGSNKYIKMAPVISNA